MANSNKNEVKRRQINQSIFQIQWMKVGFDATMSQENIACEVNDANSTQVRKEN